MKTTTATAGLLIAASVFSSLARASVTMDWVTVGNAGNAADPLTGYGSVAHEYKIGKYEVTNEQYGAFLNAAAKTDSYGLYNSNMSTYGITRSGSSGSYTYSITGALANRPVVHISWYDAARFANWLANGQGTGSTETGSYTLNGSSSGIILANAGAQVYIPTEDEWYKAAYYNAVSQSYSLYPNGQNSITTADANYANSVGSTTDVGFYGADPSSYGTFDQGGNVWEWNDAFALASESRGLRGGAWEYWSIGNSVERDLRSTYRDFQIGNAASDGNYTGFRLSSAIPEPSAMVLTMLASGVMLIRRRR